MAVCLTVGLSTMDISLEDLLPVGKSLLEEYDSLWLKYIMMLTDTITKVDNQNLLKFQMLFKK